MYAEKEKNKKCGAIVVHLLVIRTAFSPYFCTKAILLSYEANAHTNGANTDQSSNEFWKLKAWRSSQTVRASENFRLQVCFLFSSWHMKSPSENFQIRATLDMVLRGKNNDLIRKNCFNMHRPRQNF